LIEACKKQKGELGEEQARETEKTSENYDAADDHQQAS